MMSVCLAELFSILRYCELEGNEVDSLIEWGMKTCDPSVIRNCLGMMLSSVNTSPDRMSTLLQTVMNDGEVASVVSSDALSCVCYIRLCWSLYEMKKEVSYLKVLCSLAQQEVEASSMQAMEFLSTLPYVELVKLNKDGEAGNGGKFQLLF